MTEVVAALIWQGERFMACQRPAHKARGLLWEFPGGKVERGEIRREALARECREELGVPLEIDRLGLDRTDRRMLESIIVNFRGGPVGLETLAATIGEESVTLEDVYEPYLLQIGFLNRTPRGRCVTPRAYDHLGIPYQGQLEL